MLWVAQGGAEAALSFEDWRNLHFPGNRDAALDALDSDGDGNSNLMVYLAGSDTTRADATAAALSIHPVAGGMDLRWTSPRALTDVQLSLEESASLGPWQKSPVSSAGRRIWLPDGQIKHRYPVSLDPTVRSRFFRLR